MRRPAIARSLAAVLLAAAAAATPVQAQEGPVPDRRVAITTDRDFYGGDLRSIFDTTFEACQRACLADPACRAFTYNSRSRACFPKTGAEDVRPFAGALSGRVLPTDAAVRARAAARRAELPWLSDWDIGRAREQALGLGALHPADEWTAADWQAAEARARAAGDAAGVLRAAGARLTLSDSPADWLAYAQALEALPAPDFAAAEEQAAQALAAATNAWLRAGTAGERAAALRALARGLERLGRGRDALAALRLAQALSPDAATAAALAEAEARHGFRILEHEVQSDLESPRLCALFSEELARAGVDYAPFLRVSLPGTAVEAEGRQLCVTGLVHGSTVEVTFREGLPSAAGERLARSVTISQYVRDRTPAARFSGRAYVLPRGAGLAIPVRTVNTRALELVLRRVDDRNLLRAIQEQYFGRPLEPWQEEAFAAEIGEEIWRGSAEVAMELNRDVTTRLPLGEATGGLAPGIYVLRAAVPGQDPWTNPPAVQWFVVSDLGLTTLSGSDGLHVVLRSLGTAEAVAGARVTLLSRANRVLGTAETDAGGVATFAPGLVRGTGAAAPALVLAERPGEDLAFLSLTDPEFDLSDRGVAGRPAPPPVDVFVTTDRGAYRAGETVNATVLARDGAARAIPGLPLSARLLRPDGVEYSRAFGREAGAGGHVFALPIAESAPRGLWRLEILADPEAPALAARTFLVEDFLPERIDVTLALPEAPLTLGAPVPITLEARYLFGAPAAGLAIEGELVLRAAEGLAEHPGYRFGLHDEPFETRVRPLPPGLRTDAAGAARIEALLPEAADPGRPLELLAAVRLAEGSGRPVERRITRVLAPGEALVGLRPLFEEVVPEGQEARFALLAVAPPGQAAAAAPVPVRWSVSRLETRFQWYQLYGEWRYDPVTTRTRVAEGSAALTPGLPLEIAAPVGWGRHEIRLERTDGAPAAASMEFHAGWYAPAETATTPDALEVALDREAYRPGETARLRLLPRAAGVALVSVLTDRVIDLRAVEVGAGEAVIELPVTDDWAPGAYVTVSLLRPMDLPAGRGPARAVGLAHAAVDPGARRLAAAFEVAPEADPRGPLPVALRVEGVRPGETAHATIAAVDVGILNLTAFESPDPAGHYFGQRRLGVGIRDLYGRLIDTLAGAEGRVRSGGDAGAAARLLAPPPTEELLAQFSGPLTVGPDGYARMVVDLPAFNGRVRLMAVVWSETGVGQASAEVLVRDPVVVTASAPRFLAPGDESRLLLELTHASGPAGEMALELAAEGLDLGAVPQAVRLEPGGRAQLEVPLAAGAPGMGRIEVALVTPEGRRLTRALALPVAANDPETVLRRRLDLAAGQTLRVDADLFAGLRPGTGRATLALGPIARLDAAGLLEALDRYPYGCTEQIVSAAMPLLYLPELAQALGMGGDLALRLRVAQAVGEVLTNQDAGGGFGLWAPGAGDLWLDAYVTDFLSRARAEGVAVPDRAFRLALDNLRNRLNYAGEFDEGGAPYAYALMVLAREGAAAIGDLRYYADVKAHAFDTPLAAAQLGAALAAYGDQPRADRMFAQGVRLLEEGRDDPSLWRADYGTLLRDAAGLLTLAVESGSRVVDRDALALRIAAPGGAARLSTQEAVWTLLAAHALAEPRAAEGITLNGAPVEGPVLRLLGPELAAEGGVEVFNGSGRDEILTLTTFGVPETPEPAGGNGYALRRSWYTLAGDPVAPGAVAQGTRLVAVLEVRPFEAMGARLMIDDPLPAGFEIDNPALLSSGDVGTLAWLELEADVQHAEFRQDRFRAAVELHGDRPLRLAYIVRATTPGRYHLPAASVEDMYRPEFRAWTGAGQVTVTP